MTLTVTQKTFTEMLRGFIESGVTFEAREVEDGILITFTGGF
tara:strand:+ start:542 stop:667 length:126 start_codon:yes stop_codon:yes gene_type:complete